MLGTTTIGVLLTPEDIHLATLTLWGEARGEPREGKIAVAWVMRNRAEWQGKTWWGDSLGAVCTYCRPGSKWHQFSCWNEDGPNLERMKALSKSDPAYQDLFHIVQQVMLGAYPDPTGGATHYKVVGTKASWDKACDGVGGIILGHHIFFKLGPSA
jgi:spore germination cell wall hydrolase CwlJ-like protein